MLLTFGKNLTLLSCLLALVLAQFGCSRVAQKVAPEANKAAQEAEKQVIKHPEVQKVTQQGKQLIKNFRKKINKKKNKKIAEQQAKTRKSEDLALLKTIAQLIGTSASIFAEVRQNEESKQKYEVMITTIPIKVKQPNGTLQEERKVFHADCRHLDYSSIVQRNNLNQYNSKEFNLQSKRKLVNAIIEKSIPRCEHILNKTN